MPPAKTPRKTGTAPKAKKAPAKKPAAKQQRAPGEKHPGGRPPKYAYDDEETFSRKVEEFWETCGPVFVKTEDGSIAFDARGNPIVKFVRHETLDNLCSYLDINFQTWQNYRKDGKFLATITRAEQRVIAYAGNRLYDANVKPQGIQFMLKNRHGWRDETEVKTTGSMTHQHEGNVKQVVEFRVVRPAPQPDEKPTEDNAD